MPRSTQPSGERFKAPLVGRREASRHTAAQSPIQWREIGFCFCPQSRHSSSR